MIKSFFKKSNWVSLSVIAFVLVVFTGKMVIAQVAPNNFWIQNALNSLSTNTSGGLANADIHVKHCYIGTGTSTPCSAGAAGTPGGLNTQIQYNNAGAFAGISGAVTDGTIVTLTNPHIGGAAITTSTVNGITLTTGGSATTYLDGSGNYSTPTGGAISSVSNADGTLTISPTTGAVVASLALAHANTWTGAQAITAGSAANFVPLTLNQNDTTNNPQGLTINNTGTGNTLRLVPTGAASTSDSTGGALFLNDTGNTGYGLNIYTKQATAGEQFRILKDALNSTTVNGSQTLTTASTTLTVASTSGFPTSGKLIVENATSVGENNNTIFLTYTGTTGTTFTGVAGTFYIQPSITLVNLAVVKQVNSTDSHYDIHVTDYSDQFSNAKIKQFSPHVDSEYTAFGGYNNSIGQGQFGQDIPVGNSADVTKTDVYRFLGRNDANSGFNPAMIYSRPGLAGEGLVGIGFQTLSTPSNVTAHFHVINNTNFGDTNVVNLVVAKFQGALSQAADLTDWIDSTGAILASISSTGNFLSAGSVLGTQGIGYPTGAGSGGTVTQATSKSTAVTLNTYSGTITMNAAALSSATIASFTVTDSKMGANDVVAIQHDSGGTLGVYTIDPSSSTAGSFVVNVRNDGTVPLSEALVLRFAIIKASVN